MFSMNSFVKDLLTAGLVLVFLAVLSATSRHVERVFDRHHHGPRRNERNKNILLPLARDGYSGGRGGGGYFARGGGRGRGRNSMYYH